MRGSGQRETERDAVNVEGVAHGTQPCGRFVGRVGALAVALGVGGIFAAATPLAHADESGPGESAGVQAADPSPGGTSSAPSPRPGEIPSGRGVTRGSAHIAAQGASRAPIPGQAATTRGRTSGSAAATADTSRGALTAQTPGRDVYVDPIRTQSVSVRATDVALTEPRVSQAPSTTTELAQEVRPAGRPLPTSSRVIEDSFLVPSAPAAVPVVTAAEVATATPNTAESLLAALPGSGSPAPLESAVSWFMVAATRRDRSPLVRTDSAPAAAVSTGEIIDPSPLPIGAEVPLPKASLAASAQQAAPSFGDILNFTFFNRSPSANPAQAPGQSVNGVVTGNLNARSENGAPMTYTVTTAPENGKVVVNEDGTYTYTPKLAAALSGTTDSFSVTIDNGSAYRLTGIGGVIQGFFSSIAQLVGLRQPDRVTVQVPVSVAPAIVKIPVGTKPYGVAVSPDGRWVYTANYGDNTVSVVDPTNTAVARTFSVGPDSCRGLCEGPLSLALSPDGNNLYVMGGTTPVFKPDGSVDYFEGKTPLTVIDTASGTVVKRYDLGWGTDAAIAPSPDGKTLFVGINTWGQGQPSGVRVLDLATGNSSYLGVTSVVAAPSADGKTITLIDWRSDGAVYAFDVATDTQLWATRLGSPNKYLYGRSVAAGQNGRVYVTYRGASNGPTGVAVLDAATGAVIATIQTGTAPGYLDTYAGVAVSPDGKRVYAVDPNAATLSTIDTATNTVVATTPLGGQPVAVAVSPDGKYVYATNRDDGTLSVIPVG